MLQCILLFPFFALLFFAFAFAQHSPACPLNYNRRPIHHKQENLFLAFTSLFNLFVDDNFIVNYFLCPILGFPISQSFFISLQILVALVQMAIPCTNIMIIFLNKFFQLLLERIPEIEVNSVGIICKEMEISYFFSTICCSSAKSSFI